MSPFIGFFGFLLIVISEIECIEKFCPQTDSSGPKKNATCVLPFRFLGSTFTQCTNSSGRNAGRFWCPTKVSADGSHMVDKDDWGYCHQNCLELNRK